MQPAPPLPYRSQRGTIAWALLLLALLSTLAYSDSFRGPFVFDDGPATVGNPTTHPWSPLWRPLAPPPGTSVSGRPIGNLTLAINYAISGPHVWSYHALNLAILFLGSVTLFGVVRRTLRCTRLVEAFGRDADALALAIALLWALHPLQTESITYIVQRVESLMGLFYLLTLYCFIRSLESVHAARWQAGAVAACALGMGTKEVMVTAPLLVFLYDWVFVPPPGNGRWARRGKFYLALGLTWLILAGLVATTGFNRNGSAGFMSAYAPTSYWLVQLRAMVRYLHLCLWPDSLTLDYGPALQATVASALLPAAVVAALFGLTGWALLRRRPVGFLGAWFLGILAPTCIVPVGTQVMAEHRLYLSLAAIVALLVLGSFAFLGRKSYAVFGALVLAEGVLTFQRNTVYRSPVALWCDTVAKAPGNARAFCSLGQALAQIPGRLPDAIRKFQAAIRLHPNYSEAHADMAEALAREPGQQAAAIGEMETAVRIRPGEAAWQSDLGEWLASAGQTSEGLAHLQAALELEPANPQIHLLAGNALARAAQPAAAMTQFEAALRLDPRYAEANNNLGILLCQTGHPEEGIARIRTALAIDGQLLPAQFALGMALLQLGQRPEAETQFERVLALKPDHGGALRMLNLIRSSP